MPLTPPANGSHTFMHLLQTFMVEVLGQIRAQLPQGTEVTARGRTMIKGSTPVDGRWTEFSVQLSVKQFEDDMWPHLDVALVKDGVSDGFDVHPARTANEHARAIVERLFQGTA